MNTDKTTKSEVLQKLNEDLDSLGEISNSIEWAKKYNYSHEIVIGVTQAETAQGRIDLSDPLVIERYELTKIGEEVLKEGSPEVRLFNLLPSDNTPMKKEDLLQFLGNDLQPAQAFSLQNSWISISKEDNSVLFKRITSFVEDKARLYLNELNKNGDMENVEYLLKRKFIVKKSIKTFKLKKGINWNKETQETYKELSAEMISSGNWSEKPFFKINFNALGKVPTGGCLHPLMKVRQEFREIFLELGYEEMQTNRFVESSFWNFDSLFQPQQHPARDMHDTFFLTKPEKTLSLPEDFVKRTKEMHEVGGHGSIGWRYNFSLDEVKKNILRTHTTAISSRTLYNLAQLKEFTPKKYFSIDRVYRNETLDSTHLAEFHQIEGFVADYNITLTNLMGAIQEFYARIGIHELRFKPAYNPYTEPSMEIFGYHPLKKMWLEIGNSGIFRPEMLLPMGLPPGVGIAAWGLSLERPTMIMYGCNKIGSLVGPKVNLKMISTNPIPKFS